MNVRVTVMQAFLQEFGADPNITTGSVFGGQVNNQNCLAAPAIV